MYSLLAQLLLSNLVFSDWLIRVYNYNCFLKQKDLFILLAIILTSEFERVLLEKVPSLI